MDSVRYSNSLNVNNQNVVTQNVRSQEVRTLNVRTNQDSIVENKLLDLLKASDGTVCILFEKLLTYYNENIQQMIMNSSHSYES